MTKLTGRQIADEGLDGWTYLLSRLHTRIPVPDFAAGLALVAGVGAAAEKADHHPDVDLRHTHVDIRLTSHDEEGVTARDIDLARTITALAAGVGLTPERATVSRLDIALDTPDRTKIMPFWAAVTAMKPSDIDLTDPGEVLPDLWFQQSGDGEPRQRWHPDLWIDPAEVQPRIAAAVAAGGRLVSDAEAPAFWVLADPDGNKICLCTWQSRD